MRYIKTLFLLSLGLLTGCQAHFLNVQTQYLSLENLASVHVGTPDLAKDKPVIGQRLMVEWALPRNYQCFEDIELVLKVRFRNRKEDEAIVPVNRRKGIYLYYVVNQKYCETEGIATYKAELWNKGCLLETWQHPLWSELISFQIPEESQN